jgi:hypothetical protein
VVQAQLVHQVGQSAVGRISGAGVACRARARHRVLIASNALLSHAVAMAVQSAGLDGHELVVQRLPRQCLGHAVPAN